MASNQQRSTYLQVTQYAVLANDIQTNLLANHGNGSVYPTGLCVCV